MGITTKNSYWQYPVSFTWEGSNDNNSWQTIDTKDNNTDMGGEKGNHYWEINNSSHQFYRYIRFRIRNIQRTGGLFCSQLELFGDIKDI